MDYAHRLQEAVAPSSNPFMQWPPPPLHHLIPQHGLVAVKSQQWNKQLPESTHVSIQSIGNSQAFNFNNTCPMSKMNNSTMVGSHPCPTLEEILQSNPDFINPRMKLKPVRGRGRGNRMGSGRRGAARGSGHGRGGFTRESIGQILANAGSSADENSICIKDIKGKRKEREDEAAGQEIKKKGKNGSMQQGDEQNADVAMKDSGLDGEMQTDGMLGLKQIWKLRALSNQGSGGRTHGKGAQN